VNQQRVLTEEQAYELLAHLVASADICRVEPGFYGSFRLLDAASRLSGFLLAGGVRDRWLQQFHQEVQAKKNWMMWDREAYLAFLPEAARSVAAEMMRRQAAAGGQGAAASGQAHGERGAAASGQAGGDAGDRPEGLTS
jgi:hypothetical protein